MTGANCTSTSGGTFAESFGSGAATTGEIPNFFVHLSNAQLVKESFTQTTTPLAGWPYVNPEVGTGFPSMPVGTGMIIFSEGNLKYWSVGTGIYIDRVGNVAGNTLSPTEAFAFDSKLDDGNPTSGSIQAISGYGNATNNIFVMASPGATNCVSNTSLYNIAGTFSDMRLCTLRILANF